MSDAPYSPDAGKPERDPATLHTELRLGAAAATVRDDDPADGIIEDALLSAAPPQLPPAEHVNGADPLQLASEMPEFEGEPLPDAGTAGLDVQTPAQPPAMPELGPEPGNVIDIFDSRGTSAARTEPSVAADPPVDVSPILSALDAAEAQAHEPHSSPELAEQEPADEAQPDFEAPSPYARGRPRIELPPERQLFGFGRGEPPPRPRDWPEDIDDPPPLGATADTSVHPPRMTPPSGMVREGLAELHPSEQAPSPAGGPAVDALDAAAKIAAEASAAAEALENLKRLLGSRAPNVEVATPLADPPPPPPPPPPIERYTSIDRHAPVDAREPDETYEQIERGYGSAERHEPADRYEQLARHEQVERRYEQVARHEPIEGRYEQVERHEPAEGRYDQVERHEPAERRYDQVERHEPAERRYDQVGRREPLERHQPAERQEPVVTPPPIMARPIPPPMPRPSHRAMVLAESETDFERGQRTGVVLRGFLAGLGLSLAAGVVLYLFMSPG